MKDCPAFGPVQWTLTLTCGGKALAKRRFDAFFVPAEARHLSARIRRDTADPALLCTTGWRIADSFGLGMRNWTQGWGGVHDKTWAMALDLMEVGPNGRDDPARMFGLYESVAQAPKRRMGVVDCRRLFQPHDVRRRALAQGRAHEHPLCRLRPLERRSCECELCVGRLRPL